MIKFLVILIGKPLYKFFSLVFPKQQNLFAFYIQKDSAEQNLYPWLIAKEGKIQFNNCFRIYQNYLRDSTSFSKYFGG